jgi:hypothetical protein
VVGSQSRTNKLKLIDSHNLSIMRERYNSKESGHDNYHGIDIISPKEKIKIQWVVDYHSINIDGFPS